jgi:hypothetical protein
MEHRGSIASASSDFGKSAISRQIRLAANSLPDYSQTASRAPRISIHRGAKFGGALPQPFVCLANRTRPMWIEFEVSVSDHCQRFGNCLGFAIPMRRMDHCVAW